MAGGMEKKDRMKIPRQKMPEQEPDMRRENFHEVNLGLTAEMAKLEALRCLQCPKPKCVEGCPVGIQISEFIALVADAKFDEAVKVIKRDNLLPAICGRVCPQEEQCETLCVLAKRGQPVAIGNLERFVADFERDYGLMKAERSKVKKTGKSVAVVGSGPAGLACASDLIRMGHEVTVFEALHSLGGVLVYGIPEFRLPKEIVHTEIDQLRKMGVEFRTNAVIGRTDTVDELMANDYDAVFLGVGAGAPRFLDILGENLIGVYSANEFLTRVNLMRAYLPDSETPVFDCRGKEAVVFGGGNTAMDAVRTSLRLGAKNARIIYRRSEKEMPARNEEIHHAKEEGVKLLMLTNPVEFLGDENGWLVGVRVQKMELGEPDASGRRRPVAVKGSEYVILCQMAIVAIGNSPNPIIQKTTPDIEHTRWGTVVADENSGRTTKRGVFAGGDIVTGGATVILALGAGRRAAKSIDEYLRTGVWVEEEKKEAAAS
ncbi:MAG: NADPH-dependent glutamate synthase [Candidatus Eisenbacteria bacterium]